MSDEKTKSWDLDVRVRERNLRNGTLTEGDIEKFLSELPDMGEQAEVVEIPQPALGGRDD